MAADDPLAFIKTCVRRGQVRWTHHATMRLRKRAVSVQAVLGAVDSFEVIEKYPRDKYLPSYLIRAQHGQMVFHLQAATDVQGENVRIVTVYVPNPEEWDEDLRVRREPQ